jgi:hypothetical protein
MQAQGTEPPLQGPPKIYPSGHYVLGLIGLGAGFGTVGVTTVVFAAAVMFAGLKGSFKHY